MPVVAEMLNLTTELHSLAFPRIDSSPLGQEKTAKPEDAMHRPAWVLQLGVNYGWSPIVIDERDSHDPSLASEIASMNPYGKEIEKVHAGDRAPDATHIIDGPTTTTIFDLLSVRTHTVLVFPGTCGAPEIQHDLGVVDQLRTCGAICLFLVVQPADIGFENLSALCDRILVDTAGYAVTGYGIAARAKTFVVIRPDGVIGAYASEVDGLQRYFSAILL